MLVLVVVSVLWIPVVQASQGGQLFIYIQAISTYLQPPVSIVFIMGCFWKRTNEKVRREDQHRRWRLMCLSTDEVMLLLTCIVHCVDMIERSRCKVIGSGYLFLLLPMLKGSVVETLSCVLLPPRQGAFWGLAIGLTVGIIRMVLDFVYPEPLCFEEDNRPSVLKHVHYLYFSTMLSFLSLVVVLVVSLATEKPKPEQVSHNRDNCPEV